MNIKNRLTAGLLMAALLSLFGTAAWADDDGNFRAGPLKVVTQNLYVGGDILLPLSVPPEDFPAAAAEVIDQILATNYPQRAMKLSDLLRHEWPHLVGLQEVYEVKICLDPAQSTEKLRRLPTSICRTCPLPCRQSRRCRYTSASPIAT
jgi:hypothetical protein